MWRPRRRPRRAPDARATGRSSQRWAARRVRSAARAKGTSIVARWPWASQPGSKATSDIASSAPAQPWSSRASAATVSRRASSRAMATPRLPRISRCPSFHSSRKTLPRLRKSPVCQIAAFRGRPAQRLTEQRQREQPARERRVVGAEPEVAGDQARVARDEMARLVDGHAVGECRAPRQARRAGEEEGGDPGRDASGHGRIDYRRSPRA